MTFMTGKLTPRVGDRVIIAPGRIESFTAIGRVMRVEHNPVDGIVYWVKTDHDRTNRWFPVEELTVVDRKPVEWPEGWSEYDKVQDAAFCDYANVWVRKNDLAQLLATGPDMLARWDELMGGDA
jgi:hypothetical protein